MSKELTKDMEVVDAASWATVNKIRLQLGCWSFKDRPYLLEPMQVGIRGGPPRRCYMKGTQGGYTESQVLETCWGMIYGYYPRGVLYLFPTTDDVQEFSKARFGPLIAANPTTIGKYVQNVMGTKTDTAALKRVGNSNLYFRGGTLSKHLDFDARESSKLRSISVDKVVFDELDLMDTDVIQKALGRLDASTVNEEVYISNPTIPGLGIAMVYERSDQRHWFRKCGCGEWTCAELEFPDLVGKGDDGKGYIACKKCGKPVDLRRGEWVPAVRDNSEYMYGYQWSQLSSPTKDPWGILNDYRDPPNGNLADVVRLRLGQPFVNAEDKLTAKQVLACCGQHPQLDSHQGPCAMGVDVRRHKNVIIGIRTGRERYRILRVARITDWDEILRMAKRFNVRSAVVDIRPYEDSAREFQKKARFKTWLCEYAPTTPVGTQYNEKTGIVKVNRTEIFDATHRMIADEKMLELPAICPELKQFALECAAVTKVADVNKRTRQTVFRYRKVGTNPDDYRNALNYFYLAAMNGKIPVVGGGGVHNRARRAKNEYQRC